MKKLVRVICVVAFCLVAIIGMSSVSSAEEVKYTDNVIPVMTSNTSPSGKASASSYLFDSFGAYAAFNHSTTATRWEPANGQTTGWLEYDFDKEKCITKYAISNLTLYTSPINWSFEAWDEQTNKWVVLDTRNNFTSWKGADRKEFTFENTSSYYKYRLNITKHGGGAYLTITELEMMETLSTPTQTKKLKVVLEVKEQLQLSIHEDLNENANVTWTSSDATVATVDSNGIVTALKPGNTVVTASSKEKSYSESINILVLEDATDYRLAVDLKVGKACRVTVDDCTDTTNVTWTPMDPTIATVTSKGKVNAVSEGLTIVTATDADGNVIGQVYVRVRI